MVLATFGRGFYVLDDYSPLQNYELQKPELEANLASVFPIKDALVFIPSSPLGHRGKSFQGESFYTADNPSMGAVITYSIRDDYKTSKDLRKENEEKQLHDFYPSKDSIRKEDQEQGYFALAEISDSSGLIIKQTKIALKKGVNRFTWSGRYDKTSPITFYAPDPNNPYESEDQGALVLPGVYQVRIKIMKGFEVIYISQSQKFRLKTLFETGNNDHQFTKDLAEFRRVVLGTSQYGETLENKLNFIKAGLTQISDVAILRKIEELETLLNKIKFELYGDGSLASKEFEVLPGLVGSLEGIVSNLWSTSQIPSNTQEKKLSELKMKFSPIYSEILNLEKGLEMLEIILEQLKFPATPGRLPSWKG